MKTTRNQYDDTQAIREHLLGDVIYTPGVVEKRQ